MLVDIQMICSYIVCYFLLKSKICLSLSNLTFIWPVPGYSEIIIVRSEDDLKTQAWDDIVQQIYNKNNIDFLLFQADGEEEEGEAQATGDGKAQLAPPPTRGRYTATQTVAETSLQSCENNRLCSSNLQSFYNWNKEHVPSQ